MSVRYIANDAIPSSSARPQARLHLPLQLNEAFLRASVLDANAPPLIRPRHVADRLTKRFGLVREWRR